MKGKKKREKESKCETEEED